MTPAAATTPSARPPASTFHAHPADPIPHTVPPANQQDAPHIHALLEFWVASGALLRRDIADIQNAINAFAVTQSNDQQLAACAALVVYSSRLAEIRSVATNPANQRKGAARAVVNYLTEWAANLEIERVFLLTKAPEFFERCNFISVNPADLPDSFLIDHVHAQARTAKQKHVMIRDFAAEY